MANLLKIWELGGISSSTTLRSKYFKYSIFANISWNTSPANVVVATMPHLCFPIFLLFHKIGLVCKYVLHKTSLVRAKLLLYDYKGSRCTAYTVVQHLLLHLHLQPFTPFNSFRQRRTHIFSCLSSKEKWRFDSIC